MRRGSSTAIEPIPAGSEQGLLEMAGALAHPEVYFTPARVAALAGGLGQYFATQTGSDPILRRLVSAAAREEIGVSGLSFDDTMIDAVTDEDGGAVMLRLFTGPADHLEEALYMLAGCLYQNQIRSAVLRAHRAAQRRLFGDVAVAAALRQGFVLYPALGKLGALLPINEGAEPSEELSDTEDQVPQPVIAPAAEALWLARAVLQQTAQSLSPALGLLGNMRLDWPFEAAPPVVVSLTPSQERQIMNLLRSRDAHWKTSFD